MNSTRRSSVRMTSAASQRRQKPEAGPAAKKFIKMIQPSTIKEKMMKIPERFERLGPKLSDSDTVTIQTPAGFKRSIRIKRVGDEVWFENGWSEFAEAHSLSIVYPLDKVHVIESDDDDDVVEVMDDDDEEGRFTRVDISESSGDDSSEGVTDLEEMLKKKPRVKVQSEKIIID